MHRGINEGRMAARDVDSYLTGLGGTQLPVSGGIVKRLPYEMIEKMEHQEAITAQA
jgi:glutamate synthase (NADPH/NADH)